MDRLLCCKQHVGQGAAPLNPAKRLRRRSHRDRSRRQRLQTSSFASRVEGASEEICGEASLPGRPEAQAQHKSR